MKTHYAIRWHMFSYVDLRLAPDMKQETVERLKSLLCQKPETTSWQMNRINNGQQNFWVLIIGTTNSRTTQKRVREFFNERQIAWHEEFQHGAKNESEGA